MNESIPSCRICGSNDIDRYLELPDRFNPDGELYNLYECASCRIIFLHPAPDEVEAAAGYEDEGYDPFIETGGSRSLIQNIYARVKPWALNRKAALIEKYLPRKGMMLDVGTGTGAFLKVMRDRGWQVEGIEKSAEAARYGSEKLGLKIFTGDFTDYPAALRSFDAITFWHSLEHIHRLRGNLQKLRHGLKSGGYAFIALPNPASPDAAFYKQHWVAYDAPRHLWHFRPKVLIALLKEYGFTLHKAYPLPLDPFYNCLLSEGMIDGGGKWWRYGFRLPVFALTSCLKGIFKVEKASSITYVFARD